MNKTLSTICIVCPNGCRLTVRKSAGGYLVEGNKCKRGETYGVEEASAPKRIVTCVVPTESIDHPCVPVKTATPVLKKDIPKLLNKLYALKIKLPVRRGDTALDDTRESGAVVVVTRSTPFALSERKRA
ncbi:MAG: DUF1667 domain-containing protein [Chitinivibrionales bacterium]|nr:DUF1667 domain-containing protein [Chitinivibrionales bacterium]